MDLGARLGLGMKVQGTWAGLVGLQDGAGKACQFPSSSHRVLSFLSRLSDIRFREDRLDVFPFHPLGEIASLLLGHHPGTLRARRPGEVKGQQVSGGVILSVPGGFSLPPKFLVMVRPGRASPEALQL